MGASKDVQSVLRQIGQVKDTGPDTVVDVVVDISDSIRDANAHAFQRSRQVGSLDDA